MDRYERRARREERKNLWVLLAVVFGGILISVLAGFLASTMFVITLSFITDLSSDQTEEILLYGTPIIAVICLISAVGALMQKK
jgi:hypothetical protein